MSANDLLTLLIRLLFIALGFLTVVDYLRHRDKPRRDIALMFGTFGILFLIPTLTSAFGIQSTWLSTATSLALVAQPYLLLRLGQYFRPVPRNLMRVAQIGMVVFWAALIIIAAIPKDESVKTTPPEIAALLALVAYFGAIDGYAMLMFVRGALTSAGVVRQRLRFAAAGSGLLAAALLSLGLIVVIPSSQPLVTAFVYAALTGAGLAYYVSFATPRWLRRAWQLTELRSFLLHIASRPAGQRNVGEGLDELCLTATQAVGGITAAVAQHNESDNTWLLQHASSQAALPEAKLSDDSIVGRVWRERRPAYVRIAEHPGEPDRRLLEETGSDTLLAAPIAAAERTWGVLLVFLEHSSLFVEDDLDLLVLLSQQNAIFLENSALVEEMHDYSGQLAKLVEERTRELQQSQEQYRRIVETSHEGIWVTDTEYQTTFVNARMAEMLCTSVEELRAASPTDFVSDSSQHLIAPNRERRQRGMKDQYEFTFRRKDGSDLFTIVAATPLINESGDNIGTLSMVADITERKQAEAEILKLNAELEERVAERTAQLSMVNRELEAFSYSVSHDLRAPLRTMDGFSRMLMEKYADQLDDQGLHYLKRIRAGSDNMAHLIDALLHLSRVSRTELRFDSVNLSELARAITTDLQEQYPDRAVDCVIEDGLTVEGDKELLRAALSNLFNNAWKFTRKQPQARIEFGITHTGGRQAYFVGDNGVGFDMSYAGKLFGAFQRLHRAGEFEGTGIGLATVERIIHRHGGQIWADAAVDHGATFYFTL